LPHELLFLAQICTKSFVGRPHWGSLQGSPKLYLGGLLLRGEGGGKGGEEREGRSSSFALGRKRKVGASGSQHSINFLMGTL